MVVSATQSAQTELALLDQIDLPGRKAELRQFLKALTLCRTGQGKAILLSGSEGMGKTALIHAFLGLAQTHLNCHTLYLQAKPQLTAHTLYVTLIDSILDHARQTLNTALVEANKLLKPLDITWSQSDLIHLIAMMRLQESSGNHQAIVAEQLSASIYRSLSFLKRMDGRIREQIDALSQLLCDPWITVAVSMLNPINQQMQQALLFIERINGPASNPARQLTSGAPSVLPGTDIDALDDANVIAPENNSLLVSAVSAPSLPKLSEMQTALVDLLGLINTGLRGQNRAFILALDQWDSLAQSPLAVIEEMKILLSDTLRATVDQRDWRFMVIVACRSEAESMVLGGSLYNALKVKYLVPALPDAAQKPFFAGIHYEDTVVADIVKRCNGNPAWLHLMTTFISHDCRQQGAHQLDWAAYQTHYALRQASDLLDILFSKLQMTFMGEEADLTAALGKLLSRFATVSFTTQEAIDFLSRVHTHTSPDFATRLMSTLSELEFIVPEITADKSTGTLTFYSPFMLDYLMRQAHVLKDDVPDEDKLASLKKILPLSIQSGELSREKTQELVAMAAALDTPDLLIFMEESLIDALGLTATTLATKIAILESLSLFNSRNGFENLLKTLADDDAMLQEVALQQLLPYASRSVTPLPIATMLDAVLTHLDDGPLAVRLLAYQFLALCSSQGEAVIPALMHGASDPESVIRQVSLDGLARMKVQTDTVFDLYQTLLLKDEADPTLFKLALKGLQTFSKDRIIPALKEYLSAHGQNAHWIEVLMALMNVSLSQALPAISLFLNESSDIDLKLFVLKRLGNRPNPDAERVLIQFLEGPHPTSLPLELRWMAIRSLGWIGQTAAAFQTLQSQSRYCQTDEILGQALKSALTQVTDRLPGDLSPGPAKQNGTYDVKAYLPATAPAPPESSAEDEEPFIDYVLATASDY